MWLPSKYVGALLGKKGNPIRNLRDESGSALWLDNGKLENKIEECKYAEKLVIDIIDRCGSESNMNKEILSQQKHRENTR